MRVRGETAVIEGERVCHQQPRVEFGRLQAATAKFRRELAPRAGHGGTRLEFCRQGRHAVPSAASETLRQYLTAFPDRAPVIGYLSQLLKSQQRIEEARVLAARYRALTGAPWEDLVD